MVPASSSRRRANVHRTFAFYCSSPKYKNNPNPSSTEIRFGLLTLGTPEGTRNTMVPASSSRRRANVHRTFAFYCSSPKYENNPNPSPTEIRFGLLTLGTPEGTRTPNPRNRNPMLYPLSHRRIFDCPNIIAVFFCFVKRLAKNIFLAWQREKAFLRQQRTMGPAGVGESFAPIVEYEKWEIHPQFPHFPCFRLCQNLSPNLLAPLCGSALKIFP